MNTFTIVPRNLQDKNVYEMMMSVVRTAFSVYGDDCALFGGAIRDLIAGKMPQDLDIRITKLNSPSCISYNESFLEILRAWFDVEKYETEHEGYDGTTKKYTLTSKITNSAGSKISFQIDLVYSPNDDINTDIEENGFFLCKNGLGHYNKNVDMFSLMDRIRDGRMTLAKTMRNELIATINGVNGRRVRNLICKQRRANKMAVRACRFLNRGWRMSPEDIDLLKNFGLIEIDKNKVCEKCENKIADDYAVQQRDKIVHYECYQH